MMRDIPELVEAYFRGSCPRCANHSERTACGICLRCRKSLCEECLIVLERRGRLCKDCARCLSLRPVFLFVLTIVVFAVIFAFATKEKARPGEILEKKTNLLLSNWLYLEKGIRLKDYADYLAEKGRPAPSCRHYSRGVRAFEEALKGSCREFGLALDGKVIIGGEIDKSERERIGAILFAIGLCSIGSGERDLGAKWMDEAVKIGAGTQVITAVYCEKARLCEQDKNFAEARQMYKKAQGTIASDPLDSLIEFHSHPRERARIDVSACRFISGYSQAEAQFRAMKCCGKLGLKDEETAEYEELLQRYPLSEWARDAADEEEISPAPEDDNEGEETLRIIYPKD